MQREQDAKLSRVRPFDPKRTCLLLIDTQNCVWNADVAARLPDFDATIRATVLPNLKKLIAAFREAGGEVMYTVMENLTKDGRDRSLDYKLSDFFIAKGSWEAKVLDALAPGDDDIVLPKTSSGVFNSTNIEYHPAQHRHRHRGHDGLPDRPVRRSRHSRCGRPGLLSGLRERCLRHPLARAPRGGP